MRTEKSGFSPKYELSNALFVQKSVTFQTRNLQFASLPAFLGLNRSWSAIEDPELGSKDPLPGHEREESGFSSRKTLLGALWVQKSANFETKNR